MTVIATFGELLLRLSPPGRQLLRTARSLDLNIGGAECNVAIGLASLGHKARMVSLAPDNGLGRMALGALLQAGVDCTHIAVVPGRLGLYFLEPGAGLRPSDIVYDRAGSVFAEAGPADFDWDAALGGATHLHLSGITPALGPRSAEAALTAARAAKAKGLTLIFDGNYRARLWEAWDSNPRAILTELIEMADILFGNHRDMALLLDKPFSGEGENRRREAAEAGFAAFPRLRLIASTARHVEDADRNRLSARIDTRDRAVQTDEIAISGIVDRIGAGDAFAVGVLHGLITAPNDIERAAQSGLALTALKHSLPGDSSLFGPADIESFLAWEAMSGVDRRSVLFGGLAAGLAAPALARGPSPTTTTTTGRIRGQREQGLQVFRGIRYGENPARRRFQAPIAALPSRDISDAVDFAHSCPQLGDAERQDEDCLFLNIWTPGTGRDAKRPVMLYIHGGAYSNGSVLTPRTYGDRLAASGDVVVVTVNHRLNALGYLYLARLDPRFADSGNAGQLDLILALRWVRDNIATFGGDPSRILVFGQSGGGAKIATMMGMPAAEGLFHRAITMSGQQVTASGPINASRRTAAYLARLGVEPSDLSPLLTMPVEHLVDALQAEDPILGGGVYMGPVLDMKWLLRHPFWPDANPQSNCIPMMLGNTHDETRAFIDPNGPKLQSLGWDNLAARMAPDLRTDLLPEWIVSQYRARFPDWSPERVFYAATTAGRSWPGQVIEAEARARADTPTWVYQVDFASPIRPERGAPHEMDIPLAFGTLDAPRSLTGTGEGARAASRAVMDRFVAFARTGAPGADWPHYRLDRRATMIFDAQSRVKNDPRGWERELFARVPYVQPGS